ncbi:MAG: YbjQ family protein [bacterium]|nr:YbjQ family protein [bacterium]
MNFEFVFFISGILLCIIGYFVGSYLEKKHYKSIKKREKETLSLPVVNTKKADVFLETGQNITSSKMVSGCVVVSIDYFKRFLASLRNLIGGNVRSYETLVDRGRREAVLRMKEAAGSPDMIINLRIETSTIGRSANQKSVGSIEVFAYGTAIYCG